MHWLSQHPPLNAFERQVLDTLVRSRLPGLVANNLLLPHVKFRNLPNEHDLLVFQDGIIYTLDAKALWPGRYRGNGSGQWEYARDRDSAWENVHAMTSPFQIVFQKAQVLTSFLHQLNKQGGLQSVPQVVSMIVVPDTVQVELLSNPAGQRQNGARIYLTPLGEMCARIARDAGEHVQRQPDRQTLADALLGAPGMARATGQRSDNLPCSLSDELLLEEYLTSLPYPISRDLYRGHHKRWGEVRVEIIPLADVSTADAARLLRAWRTHFNVFRRLAHPNILPRILEHEQPWSYVTVGEFFSNDTLARRIEAGPLDWPTARAIFRQVMDALEYAHANDVVHRFLGPDSILVGDDGAGGLKAKLHGFFGAAAGDALTLGADAAACRANPFLAPEIVQPHADLRRHKMLDAFSVGRCLRAALTGQPEGMPAANIPPALDDILRNLDSPFLEDRQRGWAKLRDNLR